MMDRLAPSRMRVSCCLWNSNVSSIIRYLVYRPRQCPTMRRHATASKANRDNAAIGPNTLGVEHELTQIYPIGYRARFHRACGTRARAGQAYSRHRHADQILGALDRLWQQHLEVAEGPRFRRPPPICTRSNTEPTHPALTHGDQ